MSGSGEVTEGVNGFGSFWSFIGVDALPTNRIAWRPAWRIIESEMEARGNFGKGGNVCLVNGNKGDNFCVLKESNPCIFRIDDGPCL